MTSKLPVAKTLLWNAGSRKFLAIKLQGNWSLPETVSYGISVAHTLKDYVEKTLGVLLSQHFTSLGDDQWYRYDNVTVLKIDVTHNYGVVDSDNRRWFTVEEWQKYGGTHTNQVLLTLQYFEITGDHVANPHVRTQPCGLFLTNLPANADTIELYRKYTEQMVEESRLNLRLYRGILSTWKTAFIDPPRKDGIDAVWEVGSWRLRANEKRWSVEFHYALTAEVAISEHASCIDYLHGLLNNIGIPGV